MHNRLNLILCGLYVSAVLAGCDDSATPLPAQQQPAAANPLAPVVVSPTRPEIVRGGLRFIEGYQAGIQAAAAQKKPMLLFFTATWCHFCHQLAADAFYDVSVVSLSEQFVCVLVDADREPGVCQHFRVRSFPTIQFVSTRGQALNRMVGKRTGQELVRQMHAALQSLARTPTDRKTTF